MIRDITVRHQEVLRSLRALVAAKRNTEGYFRVTSQLANMKDFESVGADKAILFLSS